jgi:hypothetical protein
MNIFAAARSTAACNEVSVSIAEAQRIGEILANSRSVALQAADSIERPEACLMRVVRLDGA